MRNVFLGLMLLTLTVSAFANDNCFQVTSHKGWWSKTPEFLCIEENSDTNHYVITLKSGLPFNAMTVATFNYDLLQRAKCMDCNQDIFGLRNPSNSSFNSLAIKFDGKRDMQTMQEVGKITIGKTVLYYQSLDN